MNTGLGEHILEVYKKIRENIQFWGLLKKIVVCNCFHEREYSCLHFEWYRHGFEFPLALIFFSVVIIRVLQCDLILEGKKWLQ